MLELAQIRERVAMGRAGDTTQVELGFLAQVIVEIDEGRKARAELTRMRAREGKTFARAGLA